MKQVNVLISTYNGEKYISQQIDSILSQTYPEIKIYVRDDGSKDQTVSVLQNYCEKGMIQLLRGTNIGYGPSFLQLLMKAKDGDYWAFCDQDDVWHPDKIQRAVEVLDHMADDSANMYFHNFVLTDENLDEIGTYRNRIPGYEFSMAITECLHMGFATVINRSFRELMLQGDIEHICTHDWWAELVAMEFGNVYTDDRILAKHRRLGSSVSEGNLKNKIRWFQKAWKGNAEISNITTEFQRVFGDVMNRRDKEILSWFAEDNNQVQNSFRKCFYRKRWRSGLVSEVTVRFLMLFGKI